MPETMTIAEFHARLDAKAGPNDHAKKPRRRVRANPTMPTEDEEQTALIRIAKLHEARYPALKRLHSIPNAGGLKGGYQSNRGLVMGLTRKGMRKGVSDLFLACARGGYHGLYIEMKRRDGGERSAEQEAWVSDCITEGYRAVFCDGCDAAWEVLCEYLEITNQRGV